MKNRLFALRILACLSVLPLCAKAAVFQTGFEYTGGAPTVGTNAANLNGADGQIGTFSVSIPNNLVNFETGTGGWMLQDGHSTAGNASSDWTIRADFTSAIALDGASASFDYGTRRMINGQRSKDNTIRGYDSSDTEVFRLIFSGATNSNNPGRLGYFDGSNTVWNLPGAATADGDFPFTSSGPNTSLDLAFGATGFTVGYTGPNPAWTTTEISYLGGSDLAYLTFSGKGGSTDNDRSGFYLDNITVIPEPSSLLLLGTGLAVALAGLRRRPFSSPRCSISGTAAV